MIRAEKLVLLLVAVAAAVVLTPAASVASSVALGDSGELYVAQAGTYGDLFPDGGQGIAADQPVLAIDIYAEGEPTQRLLVPDSDGPEVERSPSLSYEAGSRTLYAIWETQRAPTVSGLYLAGLSADGWSDPIEISGDISPLKGPPQVEIASEAYDAAEDADGNAIERTRTIFHVVWWEAAGATDEVYYTPVVLDDGVYAGWNPVLRLNDFAGTAPAETPTGEVSRALLRSPRLSSGRDTRSSTIGFADGTARKFVSVETRLLPAEIGRIADDLRTQIIEIGRHDPPGKPGTIHRKLRTQIIEIGHRFNPGVIGHFADRVIEDFDLIQADHPQYTDAELSEALRKNVIDLGAELLTDVGSRPAAAASQIVEIDPETEGSTAEGGAQGGVGAVPELVEIRTVARYPLPPVGQGPVDIFVSDDGARALVSWHSDGDLLYTESIDSGAPSWTEPKRLVFGDGFDPSQIRQILQDRIRQRP